MSAEEQPKRRVSSARVDAALASWPLRDRDDAAWESNAARIEGLLTSEGDADPALLEPPLPSGPDDAGAAPAPPSSLRQPGKLSVDLSGLAAAPGERAIVASPPSKRDRSSLKDLAKLASSSSLTPTPPPSKTSPVSPLATTRRDVEPTKESGDSGVIDLKQMSQQDPGAEERAKTTPLASSELFGDEVAAAAGPLSAKGAISVPPPVSKLEGGPPSSARTSSPPSSRTSAPPSSRPGPVSTAPAGTAAGDAPKAAPAKEEKKGSLVWIAGVGGLLAVAAAAVFMIGSPSGAPVAVTPAAPHEAPAAPVVTPRPRPAPAASEAVAAEEPKTPPSGNEVDIAALPSATTAHAAAGSKALAAGPKKSVTVADTAKSAAPATNPSLVANIPMANPGTGSFNDALRQAAGPTDNPGGEAKAASGPAIDPGSVPQKPSSGAVIGGVSAAMAEARSCLGLDDPISRAAVTFESSGAVSNVVVTGFAAGKPSEACIKAAMKKAKVPPFAQPTFTQTLTVRPNS